MNREDLLKLREEILASTVPLVLETSVSGGEKFSLLIRIIHAGNAKSDIYHQAFKAAQEIEDKEDRLNALLDLLDEVELDVENKVDGREEASSITSTDASQVPQEALVDSSSDIPDSENDEPSLE